MFTCLSHDIIAHETTHAIVDRLRDYFNSPTNRDVLAFHEGIADIVAIFQHFSFPEVLRHEIRATRADLTRPGRLLELASQFGYSTGSGQALRSAIESDGARPDPSLYAETLEPHDRGSILVAAVFDAFFRIYRKRIEPVVRIATGGTGILPEGELQADLATAAAEEASGAAQDVLTMCLRAFEYLAPVDVTFGDYLRAIVTADFELNPRDRFERRAAFIDAFRVRGIFAPGVSSLAEEALRLGRPTELDGVALPPEIVARSLASQFDYLENGARTQRPMIEPPLLAEFAKANAAALQLDPAVKIALKGFHPSFHVDENGQLLVELIAQWAQTPAGRSTRARPSCSSTATRPRPRRSSPPRCRSTTPRPWSARGTYGKGTFQEVIPLDAGGALDLTIGQYLTADGTSILGEGVKPDVRAEDDPKTQSRDEGLDGALDVVGGEIAPATG